MTTVPTACEVVVIGGGLAGSSFALRLAQAGRDVLLFERTHEPHHKVCGEFLSHEALGYLGQLGMDVASLGAVPIRRVRLYRHSLIAESALPFAARSLTRRTLDAALLRFAMQSGVRVCTGTAIHGITGAASEEAALPTSLPPHATAATRCDDAAIEAAASFRLTTAAGHTCTARTVALATGKHDLHGAPRPAGRHNGLVGWKLYYTLAPAEHAALGDAVELALFPGGYAGLQPVEHDAANLCLLLRADVLRTIGAAPAAMHAYLTAHSPLLAQRLQGATPRLDRPLTVARIPYGLVQRHSPDGLWRLGDQAAVIPSFSGDGMSIALHSAALAAQHYLASKTAVQFQGQLAAQLGRSMRLATALSRLLVDLPALANAAAVWPPLLAHLGSMTRIPHRHLLLPG